MKPIAAALCMVFVACAAQAQAIYRCGTEYSQTPCPGGKVLESSDTRSAAQRAEAVRLAAQERKKAAELESERRALQSAAKPTQAVGVNGRPAPPAAAASEPQRGKGKKRSAKAMRDTDFVALEPHKRKGAKAR